MTHTISAINRTDNVYGQVWIDGVTSQPGATAGPASRSWASAPTAANPAGNAAWTWVDAAFNTDAGNNDEFVASLLPEATGTSTTPIATARPTAATGSTPTWTASATATRRASRAA